MIKHILLWKISDDVEKEANFESIKKDLLELASELDGCLYAEVGFEFGMGDYEACFTGYFKNQPAFKKFLGSPVYKSAVKFIEKELDGETVAINYVPEDDDTVNKLPNATVAKKSKPLPLGAMDFEDASAQTDDPAPAPARKPFDNPALVHTDPSDIPVRKPVQKAPEKKSASKPKDPGYVVDFDEPIVAFGQGSQPAASAPKPAQKPAPAQAPSFGQGQAPSFGQGQAPSFGQGQAPSFGQGQAPSFGQGQAATPVRPVVGSDVPVVNINQKIDDDRLIKQPYEEPVYQVTKPVIPEENEEIEVIQVTDKASSTANVKVVELYDEGYQPQAAPSPMYNPNPAPMYNPNPASAPSSYANPNYDEDDEDDEDDEEDFRMLEAKKKRLNSLNDQPLKRIDPKGKMLKDGQRAMEFAWKCPNCGKYNGDYVGLCGCGEHKPESYVPVPIEEIDQGLISEADFVPENVYPYNVIVPSLKDISDSVMPIVNSTVKTLKRVTGYEIPDESAEDYKTSFSDLANSKDEPELKRIDPKGTHLKDGQMAMEGAWKCERCGRINGKFVGLCGCRKRRPKYYTPVPIEELEKYEAQGNHVYMGNPNRRKPSSSSSRSSSSKKASGNGLNEGLLGKTGSDEPQLKRIEPKGYVPPVGESAMKNSWKCPKCGKINASYIGQCGCGSRKNGDED